MTLPNIPVTQRMADQVNLWRHSGDARAVFLDCYRMMTVNMLTAIDRGEFHDGVWVTRLWHQFADYYFTALDAYEGSPDSAPEIWREAHCWASDAKLSALQKLLIGVNAHINYDLALTLADVLPPEWAQQAADPRAERYNDHCHVNLVIARTIDAVQDEILDPVMPVMGILDRWMGPVDEFLIAQLITRWRESVWHNALRLIDAPDEQARRQIMQQIEAEALRTSHAIALK